jgi:excisionase family DNA binding protein
MNVARSLEMTPNEGCCVEKPRAAVSEHLLSVAAVAEWLGVSESWVREHASGKKRPHMPALRMGGLLRFRREEIEAWLKELKIAA